MERPSEEELNKRENRPCICITGIFPKDNGNDFPPQEMVNMLGRVFRDIMATVGFTQGNVVTGRLGVVNETMADNFALFMDEERFEAECHKENDAADANKKAEQKIKAAKISVEEMLKGIQKS